MQNSKAYIWNFINKFGAQVLWLITTMILARFLTPDDFGAIGVLSVIFMVANTLTESGLGGALIVQKNVSKEDCATIFLFNIIVSHLIYLFIYFSAEFIEDFYKVEDLATITRILSLVFVINAYGIVPNTLLNYNLRFKELCIISIISVIASAIAAIYLAQKGYGVYALVTYQIVQTIIKTICSIWIEKYKFPICFRWKNFNKLFSFGLFTTLAGVIDTIYENLLAIIFGKCYNMAQAGYLSQAKKIEEASTHSFLGAINTTTFVLLSKKVNDIELFKNEANKVLKKIPLLVFPLLLILALFAEEIIIVLFGAKWIESAGYLRTLVAAGIFMILDSISRNFIKSLGHTKILFSITLIKRFFCYIIITVVALCSLQWVLFSYVACTILGFLINCIAYCKVTNQHVFEYCIVLLKSFTPFVILSYLLISIDFIFSNIYLRIAADAILLGLYYFLYLPQNGISIKSFIVNHEKRN